MVNGCLLVSSSVTHRNRGRAKSPIQDHVSNGRADKVNGCLLVSSSGTLLGTEEEHVTNGRAEMVNGCLLVSSSGTLLGTEEEQRVLFCN